MSSKQLKIKRKISDHAIEALEILKEIPVHNDVILRTLQQVVLKLRYDVGEYIKASDITEDMRTEIMKSDKIIHDLYRRRKS